MSGQSLAHVWDVKGLAPEEKLLLLFIANNDGGLGQPYCFEFVSMGEFVGCHWEEAWSIARRLEEKGHLVFGNAEEETTHLCWIVYDGPYESPPSWETEPKKRSKRVQILLERDGPGCAYCGKTPVSYHVDHFIPSCLKGPDKLHNLLLACGPCNMAKGGKHPDEFLADRPKLLRQLRIALEVYGEDA